MIGSQAAPETYTRFHSAASIHVVAAQSDCSNLTTHVLIHTKHVCNCIKVYSYMYVGMVSTPTKTTKAPQVLMPRWNRGAKALLHEATSRLYYITIQLNNTFLDLHAGE